MLSSIVAFARRAGAAILFSIVAAGSATAGSISVRWSPVVDTNVAGYRIFYGTSPGVYSGQQDAHLATMATIENLAECTTYYAAVKAYNSAGSESAAFSNEVSGWPRPIVSQTLPDHAEQGRRLTVLVAGANFQQGASLRFSDPAIVVHSVRVDSCRGITADVTIGSGAAPDLVDVEVVNPDRVYGFMWGAFRVDGAIAPQVVSTDPVDGAHDVDSGVSPSVVFSEAMLRSSIRSDTVRLLAPDGVAVPQAPGSPTLSADGLVAVLDPASNLASATAYRIEVVGGATGVLDLSGHAMDATDRQPTGFTVAPDLAGPVITDVRSESVGPLGASILWTTDEPATSQVEWRRVGDPEYATTEVDAALVLSHEVRLSGLTPGMSYEFHVRSADVAGNSSQSSPDQTFTTPVCESDAGCDDGVFCNGAERCDLDTGLCLPGEPIACASSQQCDEAADACAASCLSDAECPSGSYCDGTTGTCTPAPDAPPLPIGPGMTWHFFQGSEEPPSDWTSMDFNDSSWSEGPGGFGYGTDCSDLHATTLNGMHGASPSLYLRRKFHVGAPALVRSLVLTVDYDAGFVAYLNGVEVARRNLAGAPPPHDATALEPHGCSGAASDAHAPEVILLDPTLLRAGTNVLALQGHEEAAGKAFTLAAELAAEEGLGISAEGDYDGDGRSDLAVYGSGRWSIRRSADGGDTEAGWGRVGDVPAPGDYDGDGKTDLAVVRDGEWIVRRSSDGQREVARWGEAGDRPVPGDYDGDGKTDLAVYRSGLWLVRNSADQTLRQEELGAPSNPPVPADYDGDGRVDPAVFRAGRWLVHRSTDDTSESVTWGVWGDLPAPHDYDGDGTTDLAVFRAGQWFVRRSSDLGTDEFVCGAAGATVTPLQYDEDGAADAATFQDGTWSLRLSTTGETVLQEWGSGGSVPVSR